MYEGCHNLGRELLLMNVMVCALQRWLDHIADAEIAYVEPSRTVIPPSIRIRDRGVTFGSPFLPKGGILGLPIATASVAAKAIFRVGSAGHTTCLFGGKMSAQMANLPLECASRPRLAYYKRPRTRSQRRITAS